MPVIRAILERPVTEPALISTERLLSDLSQLLGVPASPGQADALAEAAAQVATLMRAHRLDVTTVPTDGAPVVIGRRAGRAPFTLLLYHHYDTAPAGPWRAWNHEPFQLAEREGLLFGRGVAEGKGPLAAHLSAIAALLETEGELPCGVVVLAEGEALVGSPSLPTALAMAGDALAADACLATGGERDTEDRPFCYTGAKGLLQLRLHVDGANQALPPGLATSVANPLWQLLWALGQIKSDQEEVLIEGFYDDVEGPSRTENQSMRQLQMDEETRKRAWQLPRFLFDLENAGLVRTEATLPTCNVTSLVVEPVSDIPLIPTSAAARLDFQLVPSQQPDAIAELLRNHLAAKGLAEIAVEQLPGGYPGVHTAFEHPFIQQLNAAAEELYSAPLPLLPQGPFAQPLSLLAAALNAPVASIGCARPASATAAPNECIALIDLVRHGQLLIELLEVCARPV